ncbi:hypothetical protein ACGH2B_04365 [Streptomyces sp. BBFR2]|uniref:hypothetical protein n=1 Tax=Streptomyces sp. BBFR2 TaxID=3372854 RepID=UPI0037DA62B7
MADPAVQEVGDRLAERGLMRHPRSGRTARVWANLQMAGVVLLLMGALLATATGHLDTGAAEVPTVVVLVPGVVLALVVAGICKQGGRARLTEAGRLALRAARAVNHPPAATGMVLPAALLVAIGSAALLTDEVLREQLAQAQTAMATSGTSSSGGGSTWVDQSAQPAWCGGSDGGSSCGGSHHHGGGSSCGGGSHHGGSSCGSSHHGSSCGSSCSSGSSSCGSSCGGG